MSYLFLDLPRSVSIDCLIELKLAHEPKMICLKTVIGVIIGLQVKK